jgi:hypothetical protein
VARQRCSAGYRDPARWDGHLEHALAAKAKVHDVEHHAALDRAQLPALAKSFGARAAPRKDCGASPQSGIRLR